MIQFLHLSNLHTKAEGNNQILLRLEYIREHYPGCKLLITGDLVDDGKEEQYQALKKMLVGFECFCVPGNHDYGLMGNFYRRHSAKLFDRYFGRGRFTGKNKPAIDELNDGNGTTVRLIALDSNLETAHPFDFARGKIGALQRRCLRKLLARNSDTVIVYFHHHLLWGNPFLCLADAKKLMSVLYEQAEIVLFGHKHHAGIWKDTHKPYYILAADKFPTARTARRITIDGAEITVDEVKTI